jgi:Uma2 family endonuclease
VREESHTVSAVVHYPLSEVPYDLWLRGELADRLHLPNDGTRVEVVGGEIVVSPGPTLDHNFVVQDIQRAMFAAETADPTFRWRCVHTMDLDLSEIHDGYIPDLIVMDVDTVEMTRGTHVRQLRPDQVGLVVEVTSPSNAADDRQPTLRRSTPTKWNGYAQVGLPYYLLVDRAPRIAQTTLYSDPDPASGTYLHFDSWKFGETILLPEPFGFGVPTDRWVSWAD